MVAAEQGHSAKQNRFLRCKSPYRIGALLFEAPQMPLEAKNILGLK
jgi:hypothetical protein